MPVRCTEDQDLVGEKDERGKALSANVERIAGKLSLFPFYPLDIDRTAYIAGSDTSFYIYGNLRKG